MHLGLSPLISQPGELRTIKTFCNAYRGPQEFLTQVKVQQLISSFASMLWPSTNDLLVDVSLVQTIDEKLDEISDEQAGVSTDTDSTAYTILTAKLHMYAAIVTRAPVDSTSRSIILKMGLGAALRIIDLASNMMPKPAAAAASPNDDIHKTNDNDDEEARLRAELGLTREDCQRALHKKHFLAIVFATVFLLRYFSLNSAAPADEQQRAANAVLAAHGLFRAWSLEPGDEYGRAAVLFETLCRQAPHSADTQKLRLTDRMGVSILFDAISTAHELRGWRSEVVVGVEGEGEDTEQQTTRPSGDGDGAEASTGRGIGSDDRTGLPTGAEKGKEVAVVQPAESASGGGRARRGLCRRHERGDGGTGGYYMGGLPSDFWNNPMWEVFNFDFEAAASGQYPGDPYLPQQ
ncbi:hypothetical protein PG996_003792 [Apiospora saccharicola]|uniref:Uncharacterized protein n=1 Tax=Apiospora saccharicola TaxID=335842 RepID=A0ABR1W2E9_9PEZI